MKIKREILLNPVPEHDWEADAVFNPTTLEEDGMVHLVYRAVRHPNYSVLGYAKIADGKLERNPEPLIAPTEIYEKEGTEDPRLSKMEGVYYLLYTGWDGRTAKVILAESKDLKNFNKKGIISPVISVAKASALAGDYYRKIWEKIYRPEQLLWDKDAMLFPEKINGRYAMLHRLEPAIQIVYFDKFSDLQNDKFWEDYLARLDEYTVMKPEYGWEKLKIGGGAAPIKTDKGWLVLYHGVDENRVYRAGAALLDLNNPQKVIGRLKNFLFEPEYEWEKMGDVHNVVFPEGAVIRGDELMIFYGCADKRIARATLNLDELLSSF